MGKRRIYMSFAKNTHAILHRLNQTNSDLSNVIVIHLPIDDLISHPLKEWNTVPCSATAYIRLTEMYQKILDISNLDN